MQMGAADGLSLVGNGKGREWSHCPKCGGSGRSDTGNAARPHW